MLLWQLMTINNLKHTPNHIQNSKLPASHTVVLLGPTTKKHTTKTGILKEDDTVPENLLIRVTIFTSKQQMEIF